METLNVGEFKTYFSENKYKEFPGFKSTIGKSLVKKEISYVKMLDEEKKTTLRLIRSMIQDMSSNGKLINESMEAKVELKTEKYGMINVSSYVKTVDELTSFIELIKDLECK